MRASELVWIALVAACPFSANAQDTLIGVWIAGDRAHESTQPYLRISSSHIEFSVDSRLWECKTRYWVVGEGTNETYREEVRPFRYRTHPWTYYKLRLAGSKCTASSHFVFALAPGQADYSDFIEFRSSKWTASGHYLRGQ